MSGKSVKVQINYRSGLVQTVTCAKFKVTYNTSVPARVTEIVWENLDPKPLFFNLDAIESIWEIG